MAGRYAIDPTIVRKALRAGAHKQIVDQTVFDELSSLQTFFETQKGMWDTFSFPDPVDSTVRTCRFAQDTMDIERIVYLCWKGASAMKLISTK